MSKDHEEAFEDFAESARDSLGESLKKLVLYGSVARGEEDDLSDVDVFAVVETREQLEQLRTLAFEIGTLDHGISISVQGETAEEFEGFDKSSYLRNVEREGVNYA